MTIDAGIRARVEASMCLTYGEAHPQGREEARISREDWDALLSTLRLVWNGHHEQMTPVVKQAVRETLALQ